MKIVRIILLYGAVMAVTIIAAFMHPVGAIACSLERDYVCPGPVCLGTDPDCCNNVTACTLSGFYCDIASGTCLTRSGQTCRTQAHCSGDTYCSTDAGLCVSKRFIFASPGTLRVKVGSEPVVQITMFDPANRTGTYVLSVEGAGRYFAKFSGSTDTLKVALKPNEAATVQLYFTAGSIGNYQLKVKAVDSIYYSDALSAGNPAGIAGWSDNVNFEVSSETRVPGLVSAPGPSGAQLSVLLGLLAASLIMVLFPF